MIRYGSFLTALVTFLIIAFVLFLIIRAVQRVTGRRIAERQDCPHCLSSISAGATTCAFCAKEVPGATVLA